MIDFIEIYFNFAEDLEVLKFSQAVKYAVQVLHVKVLTQTPGP